MATDLDDRINKDYAQGRGAYRPHDLGEAETTGTPYEDAGTDQFEAFANDPANHKDSSENMVREAEDTPSDNWATNVSGNSAGKNQSFDLKKFGKKLLTKRGAAVGGVTGIIAAGGISLSMIFSPAMLLVHIKEVVLDRFNIQDTAIQERSDKILAAKIAGKSTKGCEGAKLTCRFGKMSNKMLKSMADSGIVPYKDGKPLVIDDDVKDWRKTQRPDEFRPTEEAKGRFNLKKGQTGIKAREFNTFLRNNPSAAAIFRKAFNPKWAAFWDSTYTRFLNKVGFGGKGSKIKGDDKKSIEESVKENADKAGDNSLDANGESKNNDKETNEDQKKANENATASNEGAANDVNDATKSAKGSAAELGEKVGKIGKSGALAFVSMYCFITVDAPKISKALRALQMAQLISFSLTFLQVADKIKTSNNTPVSADEVSTIGSLFTQSKKDSSGKYVKKSAMESDGMLYALEGNTKFNSSTSDITNWIPGGGIMQTITTLSNTLSSSNATYKKAVDTSCKAFNSPVGQVFQLAVDFNPAGIAIQGAMLVVTQTPWFKNAMEKLFKAMAGQLIHNTDVMEDFGNAVANGMVYSMGEGGSAGATMPMTVDQAVAYSKMTTETRIANAAIDRAELSPFDATNPNTFMGSIVTKMIPYYGAVQSSPLGALGAVTDVVSNTFSSILTPKSSAYANLTKDNLTSCGDVGITSQGIAADPICNIQYGIPTNYLTSIDPADNVQWLINKGYVLDDDSGGGYEDDDSIVSGSPLETYLTNCRFGGEESDTKDCIIDSEEKARYALYYIDHRIQKDMDGEDEYKSDASVTAASSGSSNSATTGSGAAIGDYKPGSYQCAAWVGQLVLPDIYGIANPHGNGNEIAPNLGKMGYKVDSTPAVHSIVSWPAYCNCQGGSSSAGHVGVVDAVNADGSIVVEAYNSHGDEKYAVTTITAANAKKLQYAHVEAKFGTGPVKVGSSS